MITPVNPIKNQIPATKIAQLKNFLIQTVAREVEGREVHAEQHKEIVTSLLYQAYAHTKLNLDEGLRNKIFQEVIAEIVGFGPLQSLLDDPDISEIMVSGPKLVYIEKNGKLYDTQVTFDDDAHLMRIIDRMLDPLGRRVDIDNPTADARLPDGSRVNIVIPPVAVDGPNITIRKFLRADFTIPKLIEYGSITEHMAEFLKACVVARLNILISGNTSSGKTTLLNILTRFIPTNERIITIEDAAELQLNQKYVVRMETKNANIDGYGAVTTRDLVRNALRMRPDRIVVGEVRGGETLDMLQAMNTGHDGSLTTLHANSPRDGISRLETMAMMAGLDLPMLAIRTQIASAIDLIVHMDRLPDGSRKVVRITEVPRMEGDVVTLSDLFLFDQTGTDNNGRILGDMRATGLRPLFTKQLEIAGFHLGGEIFGAD